MNQYSQNRTTTLVPLTKRWHLRILYLYEWVLEWATEKLLNRTQYSKMERRKRIFQNRSHSIFQTDRKKIRRDEWYGKYVMWSYLRTWSPRCHKEYWKVFKDQGTKARGFRHVTRNRHYIILVKMFQYWVLLVRVHKNKVVKIVHSHFTKQNAERNTAGTFPD